MVWSCRTLWDDPRLKLSFLRAKRPAPITSLEPCTAPSRAAFERREKLCSAPWSQDENQTSKFCRMSTGVGRRPLDRVYSIICRWKKESKVQELRWGKR